MQRIRHVTGLHVLHQLGRPGLALAATVSFAAIRPAQAHVPLCQGLPAAIVGTAAAEVLMGTAGPDVIVGLGGNDTIVGFGDNDTICGSPVTTSSAVTMARNVL
jgi:Ca2+-binding RTX toxin-like protein